MGLFDKFKKNKPEEEQLPFIAKVDIAKLMEEREKNFQFGEKSLLASVVSPRIRLCYVALEKFVCHMGALKLGTTIGVTSEFFLPHRMTIEQACKVVSYLSEKVEKQYGLQPGCEKSVALVSRELEKYGFNKREDCDFKGHFHSIQEYVPFVKIPVTFGAEKNYQPFETKTGVTDLFTVGGDFKLFKRTKLYSQYFDWFTSGVTKEEIAEIYENTFTDVEELYEKE